MQTQSMQMQRAQASGLGRTTQRSRRAAVCRAAAKDPLLLRVARGEGKPSCIALDTPQQSAAGAIACVRGVQAAEQLPSLWRGVATGLLSTNAPDHLPGPVTPPHLLHSPLDTQKLRGPQCGSCVRLAATWLPSASACTKYHRCHLSHPRGSAPVLSAA